ncbi:MAG: FxsA family protein [Gordonia sp. (in: high G+C Gram-positive bacteria)]
MKSLVVAGYLIVEIAAFAAMVHFLGWGWAFLITVAATAVGFAVLGRRARQIVDGARQAMRNEESPVKTLSDSALFAVAAILTILPGVVSTVLGLILMAAPVRRVLRPVVTAAAARRVTRFAERVTLIGTPYGGASYIDGAVVDGGTVTPTVVDTTVRNPDGSVYTEIPALPAPYRR